MPFYTKNYLTNVIGRIDYQPILILLRQEPADFQETIRHTFPRFSKELPIVLKPVPEPQDNYMSKNPFIWKFENKLETQVVTLTSDFIAFETKSYTEFADFSQKLSFIYRTFYDIYKPDLIKKIGLRYINQIRLANGNPLDWDGLINSDLTSCLRAFPNWKENTLRCMQQLHLRGDDYRMIFQFGVFNSQYPNNITKKEFILDYDCQSEQDIEPTNIMQHFERFNKEIETLFEASIMDGLRDLMEVSK